MTEPELEKLLDTLCECQDDIPYTCHFCQINNCLKYAYKKLERMNEYRRQYNEIAKTHRDMQMLFKLQRNALDSYYHELHKHCPCKLGEACESPWRQKVGQQARVIHSSDN